jgi:1-phosphofructokinase
MIVTLTPNPSLDRTIELAGPLARGDVQRAVAAHQEPGGKGVNICRALEASGVRSLAILPGDIDDPVLLALTAVGIPHWGLPIGATLRSNVAITEPDGTTTKLNEPGPTLTAAQQRDLVELVLEKAEGASWLVLAGSLPPGVPVSFYADITRELRSRLGADAPSVAIDSSGAPLAAAVAAQPDLIKPNAEELAELTGFPDPDALEADPDLVVTVARTVISTGVGAVLATLGAAGAVLVTADGAWLARGPKIVARSTVGAGDSALAGYLLSTIAGASASQSLRQAAAHGAAAAALPGSTVPSLAQTQPDTITVTALAAAVPTLVPPAHPKEDDQ